MKQSPTALSKLQEVFYLSEGEKHLLLAADIGEGLFFAGNNHVAMRVVASPDEHILVTSSPQEIIKLKAEREGQPPTSPAGTATIKYNPPTPASPAPNQPSPSIPVPPPQTVKKPLSPTPTSVQKTTSPTPPTIRPSSSSSSNTRQSTDQIPLTSPVYNSSSLPPAGQPKTPPPNNPTTPRLNTSSSNTSSAVSQPIIKPSITRF